MKKIAVGFLLALCMVFCTLFTACDSLELGIKVNNSNDTYEGTVSEQSYESQNDAASAFVAAELSGSDYRVEMTKYEKQSELSSSQISKLNIEGEVDGTINSVEKGRVYYREAGAVMSVATPVAETDDSVYVTIYIIVFTATGAEVTSYKYYVPLPENGEAISYSYYSSVLNSENYLNCTVKSVATSSTTMVMGEGTVSSTSDVKYDMYLNSDKMMLEFSITSTEGDESQTLAMTVYMVDTTEGVKCAAVVNGVARSIHLYETGLNITSVSEAYASQLTEAQCSLFVKTSYGFKLKENALKELAGGALELADFDGDCDYYVTDGRLSKAVCNFSFAMTDPTSNASMSIESNSEVVYSDFGTTTVTLPEDVKTVLGIE